MDALDLLRRQRRAEAERVGAGRERPHGALLDADRGADRAHLERVGDHDPVEAELVAQQPVQRARLRVAGSVVERRHADVRGHDRLHARPRSRPRNGGSARSRSVVEVDVDGRQLEVRVGAGRAVAGEVLRARGDAARLEPAHERRDVPRDERADRSRTSGRR